MNIRTDIPSDYLQELTLDQLIRVVEVLRAFLKTKQLKPHI